MDLVNELTLILLKPDAVEQGLQRDIEALLTASGELKILVRRQIRMTPQMVRTHYPHRTENSNFPILLAFMTRGPCLAMIVGGPGAISRVRNMIGDPDPRLAAPDTIRGIWGKMPREGAYENVIHASGNTDEAIEEIIRFFDHDAPDG